MQRFVAALIFCSLISFAGPADAQTCIRDQYGRVVCGERLSPYTAPQYDDDAPRYYDPPRHYGSPGYYGGDFVTRWQDCPAPGMVPTGRGGCRPWRPAPGSECPPGMTLQGGRCQAYRGH
jgi:hypothetical protein